jgi:uncharacterized protein (UPF0332 family)
LLEEIRLALKKSDEKLRSARVLYEKDYLADAVSRLYYAILHVMGACLKAKAIDLSKHTHVFILSQFQKHFIQTHIFPQELYVLLVSLKQTREWGDYNLYENIEHDKASYFFDEVPKAIENIKKYLKVELGSSMQFE